MEIEWHIGSSDVRRVQALVHRQADNALVRARTQKNLSEEKSPVRRAQFWFQMVAVRLTSVQRSGPDSHVASLIRTKPFPLAYKTTLSKRDIKSYIAKEIKRAGGIRFSSEIAENLAANLDRLEQGEWADTLKQCNRLTQPVLRSVEKEVADYIDKIFDGFGPKQSRNLLQALGLTRFEIPIDSRVTDWLNEFGFPLRLSATALADSNYYNFVSDGIQHLCKKCDVFPCVLDAAIFALKDGNAWTEKNAIY